jgi:hypothetical protein
MLVQTGALEFGDMEGNRGRLVLVLAEEIMPAEVVAR